MPSPLDMFVARNGDALTELMPPRSVQVEPVPARESKVVLTPAGFHDALLEVLRIAGSVDVLPDALQMAREDLEVQILGQVRTLAL